MTGIVVKMSSLGTSSQNQPVTLTNKALFDAGRRIDSLLDVTADSAATPANSTLVYDPDTDKYIVKLLDLDGGSF